MDDFTIYYTGEEGGPGEEIIGDVNCDWEITIADVNAIINVILNGTTDANLLRRADVNDDGEITVADVNKVISLILY